MNCTLLFTITLSTSIIPLVLSNTTYANCSVLLDNFAKYTSEFVQCAVHNSRPIKLCEKCVNSSIEVFDSYSSMSTHSDGNGPCINKYVNVDRLQIVLTLYKNTHDLWKRAKCYECFSIIKGEPQLSNETVLFDKLHSQFLKCTDNNVNSTNICNHCMDDYLKLNDYYNSISNENEKIGVCMDIVDVMNTTRLFWSDKCCKARQHPEYIFLGSTVIVFLLTIAFYVLVKLCNDKKKPTILQQSRFAGSLNHFSSTSES